MKTSAIKKIRESKGTAYPATGSNLSHPAHAKGPSVATGNQSEPHSSATLDVKLSSGDLGHLSHSLPGVSLVPLLGLAGQAARGTGRPTLCPSTWLAVGEDRSASPGHGEDPEMEEEPERVGCVCVCACVYTQA